MTCLRLCRLLERLTSSSNARRISETANTLATGPLLERDAKCTDKDREVRQTAEAQGAKEDVKGWNMHKMDNNADQEEARENAISNALSPSPSIHFPPSPTLTANFSSSSSSSSSSSLRSFAPSHSLQLLLDAAASGDDSEAATRVVRGPNSKYSSELRDSLRACGFLLSPTDEDQVGQGGKRRGGRDGTKETGRRLQVPAVTPTLARAPAPRGRRMEKMLPAVTPTLARLQGVLNWEVYQDVDALQYDGADLSKIQRSSSGRSRRVHSKDENERGKVRSSRKNNQGQVRRGTTSLTASKGREQMRISNTALSPTSHDLEYPGFFQQVRELEARGLLGAHEGRAICSRALAGDQRLISMYQQRKRVHLIKGVHCTCLPSPPEGCEIPHRATRKTGADETVSSQDKDWVDFAKALKRFLNDHPAQNAQTPGRVAAR